MLKYLETARTRAGRALAVLSGAALMQAAAVGAAAAETNRHVSVGGMYAFSVGSEFSNDGDNYEVDLDSGFGGYIAVGGSREFAPSTEIRAEFELGYFSADTDELTRNGNTDKFRGEASSLNLMVNTYLSFGVSDLIRPYAGGGIGVARTKVEAPAQMFPNNMLELQTASSESDWEFAYQAMAGVGFAVTDSVELRVGYRYFGVEDFGSHSAEAGLIFRF